MCTPPTYRVVQSLYQSHSEVLREITPLLRDGKLRPVEEMDRPKLLGKSTVDWARMTLSMCQDTGDTNDK